MAKVEKVKTVMKRDVKRKLGPAGKKNQEYVHNLNETIGLYFSPQNEEKRKEKRFRLPLYQENRRNPIRSYLSFHRRGPKEPFRLSHRDSVHRSFGPES